VRWLELHNLSSRSLQFTAAPLPCAPNPEKKNRPMKITHLLFATDFCAPGRGRVFVPSLVLAVLLAGIPAVSAADTASECSKATGETSIAACSLLIESNRLSTADLAVTYNYRGVAYARSGEFDRAIADFGEAIRRYPKSALFYPYITPWRRLQGEE